MNMEDLPLTLPAFPSPRSLSPRSPAHCSSSHLPSVDVCIDPSIFSEGLMSSGECNAAGNNSPRLLSDIPAHGTYWERDFSDSNKTDMKQLQTSSTEEDEDTLTDDGDPSRIYDAMISAGVPKRSMQDVFKAMGVWHCRCCTQLNQKHDVVCISCEALKGSFGIRPSTPISTRSNRTAIGYDERMKLHREVEPRNIFEQHPERPDRIGAVYSLLESQGLLDRCVTFSSKLADREDLLSCHTKEHCDYLEAVFQKPHYHINGDTYACTDTKVASHLSVGIVVDLTARVVRGEAKNAFAVVRPPGHHAEPDQAMGFCMYNNIGVAARTARNKLGVNRVLIVDWDIHHGNGTEHMFEDDPSVMYCSLHRFDRGEFYPGTGSSYCIGKGAGTGYNINIAWPHGGMGDAEYVSAFSHVLMPVFVEFNPELVLVSAGFDSALGDPLGGCKVSPAGYAYMTSMLCTLAHGKVVMALEGGYNLNSIARSVEACVRSLLGDAIPPVTAGRPCDSALATIAQTQRLLAPYWDCLKVHPARTNFYSYNPGGSHRENMFHSITGSPMASQSPRISAQIAAASRYGKPTDESHVDRTSTTYTDRARHGRRVQVQLRMDASTQAGSSDCVELTPEKKRHNCCGPVKPRKRSRKVQLWSGRKQFLVWRWWAGSKSIRALKRRLLHDNQDEPFVSLPQLSAGAGQVRRSSSSHQTDRTFVTNPPKNTPDGKMEAITSQSSNQNDNGHDAGRVPAISPAYGEKIESSKFSSHNVCKVTSKLENRNDTDAVARATAL